MSELIMHRYNRSLNVTSKKIHFFRYDPEYLFTPLNGFAKHERSVLEQHFPVNYSNFQSSRLTRGGRFGRIIVAPKDKGSILRTRLWNQLLILDQVKI